MEEIRPVHYKINGHKECKEEIADAITRLGLVCFEIGNVVKYVYRKGNKPNATTEEDETKAQTYKKMSADELKGMCYSVFWDNCAKLNKYLYELWQQANK